MIEQLFHVRDYSSEISRIADVLAAEYINRPSQEVATSITVPGVENTTSVEVVHSIVTVAAKAICTLGCTDCKDSFQLLLRLHTCEISLRIMDLLHKQNRISSCESVIFDATTETIQAVLCKSASLSTRRVVSHPPIYFGPFENLCEVKQREFAVSSATSKQPVLATWRLAGCIAAVGFDKVSKVGFLFHIDASAYVRDAIGKFIDMFDGKKHVFEYFLIGGAIGQQVRSKDDIEKYFQNANNETVRFEKREIATTPDVPLSDFMADTYWSRSMRLARSVAIDLRKEDPLSSCTGYEPEINPYSSQANSFDHLTSLRMKCVLRL